VALRAGAGDPHAVADFVAATSRRIWRLCAALVDPGSADDLTQETYLRAVRSLPGYRGDSDPVPWLQTIARRVCADEVARRQRARRTTTRLRAERVLEAAEPALGVDVADALDRLAPERRRAFLLTAVAGVPYAEAAEICGCAVGTIRSRVARARGELGDALRSAARC
jgi:RNA polymerase sigma-70 factor (ECF subfamily)